LAVACYSGAHPVFCMLTSRQGTFFLRSGPLFVAVEPQQRHQSGRRAQTHRIERLVQMRNLNLDHAVETPAEPKPMRTLVLFLSLPSFKAQAMANGTDAETVFPKRSWVL